MRECVAADAIRAVKIPRRARVRRVTFRQRSLELLLR